MVNILLVNIFILVNDYGPYVISALICVALLAILWRQRAALFALLWATQNSEPDESRGTHKWIRVSIVFAVSIIMITGAIHQHYLKR